MGFKIGIGIGMCHVGYIPPYTPLVDDPTLGLWLDAAHPGSLLQTASGSPATADDQHVEQWVGRVGGINAGLNGAEYGTYKASAQNGLPGVRFGSGKSLVTDSFLGTGWGSAVSIYVASKVNSFGLQVIIGKSGGGNFYLGTDVASGRNAHLTGGPPVTGGHRGYGTNSLSGYTSWGGGSTGLIGFTLGSTEVRTSVNGVEAGFPRGGTFPTTGGLGLGIIPGTGYPFDGWILEVLAYNAEHPAAQSRRVLDYLDRKWSLGYAADVTAPNVHCVGNSLTYGADISATTYYPQLMETAHPTWRVTNCGIGGITTPTLQSRQTPMIAALDPRHSRNVAVLWEVSNHIDQGYPAVTARQAVDAYWTWCDAWRAGGWRVVASTVTPRSGVANAAAKNALFTAANALILAEYATHADAVMDPASHANLTDPSNTTYYSDGVHMTNAGYAIVAALAGAAVAAVL